MKSSPPVKRLSHRLQTQTEITPDDITVTSGLLFEIRFKAAKKKIKKCSIVCFSYDKSEEKGSYSLFQRAPVKALRMLFWAAGLFSESGHVRAAAGVFAAPS